LKVGKYSFKGCWGKSVWGNCEDI